MKTWVWIALGILVILVVGKLTGIMPFTGLTPQRGLWGTGTGITDAQYS